jgi:secretion/DNA translocation related TadE-like protein
LPPKQSRQSNPGRRDRGSATLLAVAAIALIVVVSCGAAVVGSAVIARHRAQAAADLAALAAAGRLAAGRQTACVWGVSIAEQMRGRVTACTVYGLDVVISVDVDVALGRWGVGTARGTARAGPAEAPQILE